MAYRRRQGNPRSSTFQDLRSTLDPPPQAADSSEPPPSLAAQAIRASSAHRDSSLSSAYAESAISSSSPPPLPNPPSSSSSSARDSGAFEYTSMKNSNESKYGFWGVLARKAKSLVDEDNNQRSENYGRKQPQKFDPATSQFQQSYTSLEGFRKAESPSSHRSPDSIASSLNHIGGTIKNAFEEGLTIVENRTADIIQETRKLNIRRKGGGLAQNQAPDKLAQHDFSNFQAAYETQLKASRDVANAMSAKAKLLLRELKTVKADLAFAKERCAQLEEENKVLRESHEKGGSPDDDDLIRLQLETLLAEKGRLAHENSVYARENRFLREIVEYHQLTMQDVVYVDEGIEEVSEVFSSTPSQILSRTSSLISNSSVTNVEHAPADNDILPPLPSIPSSKPVSIVIPEACPIVPTPPTPSPSEVVLPDAMKQSENERN